MSNQNPSIEVTDSQASMKIAWVFALFNKLLSPSLQELDSLLLDWYYSKVTDNDELMAGPTVVQFIFIEDFKDDMFLAWCKLTRERCADAGFHTVRIWRASFMSKKYVTIMTTCGFAGVSG